MRPPAATWVSKRGVRCKPLMRRATVGPSKVLPPPLRVRIRPTMVFKPLLHQSAGAEGGGGVARPPPGGGAAPAGWRWADSGAGAADRRRRRTCRRLLGLCRDRRWWRAPDLAGPAVAGGPADSLWAP